jgi:hypothetical protein
VTGSGDEGSTPVFVPNSQGIASLSTARPERFFRNKRGTLIVGLSNLQWVNSHEVVGNYGVSGTGAYFGVAGSGHVQVTWTGNYLSGKVTDVYS